MVEEFVERRLCVAAGLALGGCGGSYADACMLISAVMSGVAAYVWPGTGIDRARFVEAWVRFAAPALPTAVRISVPVLRHALYNNEHVADVPVLEQMRPEMFGLGYGCRVVVADEVDADESEVAAALPHLERRFVRRFAYPTVFYEHVRSPLVHEYRIEGFATAHPMTSKSEPGVSYSNTLRHLYDKNGDVALDGSTREIHFHLEWLMDLTRTMARAVDKEVPSGGLQTPPTWWLHGG